MPKSMRTYFRLIAEDRQHGLFSKLAYPLAALASAVYHGVSSLTRSLYEKKILKRKRLPYPVVSIGNITWGGAGKTPLVEYLARKIVEMRRTPLILTRGYSQDEVNQLKNHLPRVLIGVGKDRAKAAENIKHNRRVHVALLDDGMQHWPLERDVEIIVVNALNPFGNERMIPRGILREPLDAIKRASVVVLTHVNLVPAEELEALKDKIMSIAPKVSIVESYLDPLFFYRANRRKRVSLERLQDHRVTTFSGVGTPRSFQLLLSQCQIKPARNFEFSDHHEYADNDLEEVKRVSQDAAIHEIITTEKDFYRSPDRITKILNPLILATRLRISSGEDVLTRQLFHMLGVSKK